MAVSNKTIRSDHHLGQNAYRMQNLPLVHVLDHQVNLSAPTTRHLLSVLHHKLDSLLLAQVDTAETLLTQSHMLHRQLEPTLLASILTVSTTSRLHRLSRLALNDLRQFRLHHLLDLAAITTKPHLQAQQYRHQAHVAHHLVLKLSCLVRATVVAVGIPSIP